MDYAIVELHRELALVLAQIKELDEVAGPSANLDVVADATAIFMLLKMKEEGLSAQIEVASSRTSTASGILLDSSPTAIKAREWDAQAAEWQKEYDARHGRLIDRIAADAESMDLAPVRPPIIWHGTQRELAAEIVNWWEKKFIVCDDEREALRICGLHFAVLGKDGKVQPINIESLIRNYEQQKR
jgi:hypothetical protein